jgi:methyl-accepting chemotaxis protein
MIWTQQNAELTAIQAINRMSEPQNKTKTDPATNFRERSGKFGHLKHQFLWCFIAITLVTTGVSIALMIELGSPSHRAGVVNPESAVTFLAALRWCIVWGAALIITTVGGVFIFLNGKIARPLAKTAAAVERMAEGCLETTIPDDSPNEIGRIGASVNGLAVNFQEVLILVWNQTDNAITRIRRTAHQLTPDIENSLSPDMMEDLVSARQDLESMQMMVRSFDLYDVAITESDVLAAKSAADTMN